MDNKSVFNIDHQNSDISSKIVAGLSRISEAFKVLLWEKAKLLGLSPIQIQLLIFIAYHKSEITNVSYLAKEFNLTKPTISDAIKALYQKGLVTKEHSTADSRSYSIRLSENGKKMVTETENFANPLKGGLKGMDDAKMEQLFTTLCNLIHQLNQSGILRVQRSCYSCKYHDNKHGKDYCNFLNTQLLNTDIRLDCPEFEENTPL